MPDVMPPSRWPPLHLVAPPSLATFRLEALARDINELLDQHGAPMDVEWRPLLNARAAMLGVRNQGRISPNGSCRLCRTIDGWVALNLSRPDDWASVDALIGRTTGNDPWAAVEHYAATCTSAALATDARLLGLPAGLLTTPLPGTQPYNVTRPWLPGPPRPMSGLRVVDLSAMWAGPLAAMILAGAGAEVLKVESVYRPDGARGTPAFYQSLHPAGQRTVVLDFSCPAGRDQLRTLIDEADVVIEASRPRALEQLGVDPTALSPRTGRIWLSITGYGRASPGRDWVAFGDDAAVAGGLVAKDAAGDPIFCGDAIADPVSGLFGARAVLHAARSGGGHLIDLAMSRCAGALIAADPASPSSPVAD